MNARAIWLWLTVALVLFACIALLERFSPKTETTPVRVLPRLNAAAVTSIQVRPGGPVALEIRADRTNATWQLVEPIAYPAQAASIENLLAALERLTPAAFITPAEMRSRPDAEEAHGFSAPQASLFIQQGDYRAQVLFGATTAPGDQVFLQVVGVEGIYVVDAALLKSIPRSANDWRDTTLVNLERMTFERLAVTNSAKALVLQKEPGGALWRMVWPFVQGARADNVRVKNCLEKLQAVRVLQFVSEDSKPDLESFGLAPPELELCFAQGTNAVAWLQFGKSPTNDSTRVYARRAGQNSIFTVSRPLLEPWRASVTDFRDPRLLDVKVLAPGVETLEVQGTERFTVERKGTNTWRVFPQDFPADARQMDDLLAILGGMPITQYVNDVVNPADLPAYGLGTPAREFVLKSVVCTNAAGVTTNSLSLRLSFGMPTNAPDRIFARRSDEPSSVYAVSTNDFSRLPAAAWQLRERRLWHLPPGAEKDVARVTIRQRGKVRQLVHNGPHQWSLAPGSQGVINDLAIEETVRGLLQVSAVAWAGMGETNRVRYGLGEDAHQVTLELKDATKLSLLFGGESPAGLPYAGAALDGQFWVFEFPWPLCRDVLNYLSIPANL